MKLLLTIAFMALVSGAGAQELQMDSTTNTWMYRGIIQVDSVSSGDLYERVSQWIARYYRSADAVIQYTNKEEGKIIAKGNWAQYKPLGWVLEHTLIVELKDGRVRYTFTDFSTLHTSGLLAGTKEGVDEGMSKKSKRKTFAKESAETASKLEKGVKSVSQKTGDW